jgi:hypothetical protein
VGFCIYRAKARRAVALCVPCCSASTHDSTFWNVAVFLCTLGMVESAAVQRISL